MRLPAYSPQQPLLVLTRQKTICLLGFDVDGERASALYSERASALYSVIGCLDQGHAPTHAHVAPHTPSVNLHPALTPEGNAKRVQGFPVSKVYSQ